MSDTPTTAVPFPPLFKEFCSDRQSKYAITEPWVKGGKLYATDGKRAIRMNWTGADTVIPPTELERPDVDSVFPDLAEYGPEYTLTHTAIMVDCPKCAGTGEFECACPDCEEEAHECAFCEGEGEFCRNPLVQCGACWINIELCRPLIMAGAKFRAHHTSDSKAVYALLPDGSEALVMSVNKVPFEQHQRDMGVEPCNDGAAQ